MRLGISTPGSEALFVCIEPWHGISDNYNHNKEFTQKEGVIKLEGGKSFNCEFTVEILNKGF